jgi:lipopolysaccharide export system permease protein
MKMVDRLIWRELLGPVLNSIFMFLILLFTSTLLNRLTDLMVRGASLGLVAKIALLSLPQLITQTLPMGLLLGTILAMSRLSGDSENIALHACGISFYRIVRPVAWMGFLIGVTAIVWNETVVPPTTREFYNLSQNVVEAIQTTVKHLRYDVKRKNSDAVDEVVIIDGGYDRKSHALLKVTIFKMSSDPRREGQPEFCVYAEKAVFYDPQAKDATFYDCYVQDLRPDPNRKYWPISHFDVAQPQTLPKDVSLGKDFTGIMQQDITDNRRMTFQQLRDKIKEERANMDAAWMGDEFDLWSKISVPLASLIFALVAAPLGIRPQRGSKTMGFGIAIVIIFLYWVVHNWMFQVSKGGNLPPMLAAFTADIFGLIAGVILVSRTRQ